MQNELKNIWANRSMESLANKITTGVYQFRQEYKGMGGKMTPRYNNAVEWTGKKWYLHDFYGWRDARPWFTTV